MAFREVTMLEIKEVLRRWLGGEAKKRIVLDPKNTIYSAKRLIGRKYFSEEVKKVQPNLEGIELSLQAKGKRSDGFFGFCLAGVLRERVRPLPTRDGCPERPPPEPVLPSPPDKRGPGDSAPPPPTIVGEPADAKLDELRLQLSGA